MPSESPWHRQPPEQLPEPHDPEACPVCAPVLATAAYRRGLAAARAAAALAAGD